MRILQINNCPPVIQLEETPIMLTFRFYVVDGEISQADLQARLIKEALAGLENLPYRQDFPEWPIRNPTDEKLRAFVEEFVAWSMDEAKTALGTWFRDIIPEDGALYLIYGADCHDVPGQRNIRDECFRFLRSRGESTDTPYEDEPWLTADNS